MTNLICVHFNNGINVEKFSNEEKKKIQKKEICSNCIIEVFRVPVSVQRFTALSYKN